MALTQKETLAVGMYNDCIELGKKAHSDEKMELALKYYASSWGFAKVLEDLSKMIESDRLILECGGDSDLIASLHEYGEETARFCYDLGNKVNKIFKKPKINDGFSPPKGIF